MISGKDIINEIEKKIHVEKWEHLGIQIWPLIRLIICLEMGGEIKPQIDRNNTLLNRLKGIFSKIFYPFKILCSKIRDFRSNSVENNPRILLLGRSTSRNTKLKNKWLDPILDSFRYFFKKIGKNCLHLEFDFWGTVRIPRYSSSRLIHNNIHFLKLKAFIRMLLMDPAQIILPEFSHFLQSRWDIDLQPGPDLRHACQNKCGRQPLLHKLQPRSISGSNKGKGFRLCSNCGQYDRPARPL